MIIIKVTYREGGDAIAGQGLGKSFALKQKRREQQVGVEYKTKSLSLKTLSTMVPDDVKTGKLQNIYTCTYRDINTSKKHLTKIYFNKIFPYQFTYLIFLY